MGYEQQIRTLDNLIKTRQTLIERNVKLIRQAKQASCLHNQANLAVKIDQSERTEARRAEAVREPVEHASMAEMLKPDAPSGMETDEPEQETSGNTQHNNSLESFLRLIKNPFSLLQAGNASDTFFDADATVLGSETSSSGDRESPTNKGTKEAAAEGKANDKAVNGDDITTIMTKLGAPIPNAVRQDLDVVSAAVIKAGSLTANKPQENQEQKGQVLELENIDLDLGKRPCHTLKGSKGTVSPKNFMKLINFFYNFSTGELGSPIERPSESTLPRIDFKDLPSISTVPKDFEFNATLLDL